jgi:hypothetical protein
VDLTRLLRGSPWVATLFTSLIARDYTITCFPLPKAQKWMNITRACSLAQKKKTFNGRRKSNHRGHHLRFTVFPVATSRRRTIHETGATATVVFCHTFQPFPRLHADSRARPTAIGILANDGKLARQFQARPAAAPAAGPLETSGPSRQTRPGSRLYRRRWLRQPPGPVFAEATATQQLAIGARAAAAA